MADSASAEVEILRLSAQVAEAERRKDADGVARYLAADYVGIDPSGKLIDRTLLIERYRRIDFHLDMLQLTDISISAAHDSAWEVGLMQLAEPGRAEIFRSVPLLALLGQIGAGLAHCGVADDPDDGLAARPSRNASGMIHWPGPMPSSDGDFAAGPDCDSDGDRDAKIGRCKSGCDQSTTQQRHHRMPRQPLPYSPRRICGFHRLDAQCGNRQIKTCCDCAR